MPRESILSRSHGRQRGFTWATDRRQRTQSGEATTLGWVRFSKVSNSTTGGGGVTREGSNTQQEAAAPSLGRLPLDVGGGGGEPGRRLLLTTQQPEGRERSGRNPVRIFHWRLIWKFELSCPWWTDPIRRRLRDPGNYREIFADKNSSPASAYFVGPIALRPPSLDPAGGRSCLLPFLSRFQPADEQEAVYEKFKPRQILIS